jgi:hypothetical protein
VPEAQHGCARVPAWPFTQKELHCCYWLWQTCLLVATHPSMRAHGGNKGRVRGNSHSTRAWPSVPRPNFFIVLSTASIRGPVPPDSILKAWCRVVWGWWGSLCASTPPSLCCACSGEERQR